VLRRCGEGRRECQVLWISPWGHPEVLTQVVHPLHHAMGDGFNLDGRWITDFWGQLARDKAGVRVQVHTHPGRAFHSPTDDAWPIIHVPGFLSVVIPDFASGPIGFDEAYLAEIAPDGTWRRALLGERIELVP
jgi:hypothetical protein